MKIYFAGSIRGGRDNAVFYPQIIAHLKNHGIVLTEHVGDQGLDSKGEEVSDKEIFRRDADWLNEADVVVADVSSPSLGVGYELGTAEALRKPVLCLFKSSNNSRVSAMISGNEKFKVKIYANAEEAAFHINEFFASLKTNQ